MIPNVFSFVAFSTFLALNFFYEPADWAHPVFCIKYIALELNCQYLFKFLLIFLTVPFVLFVRGETTSVRGRTLFVRGGTSSVRGETASVRGRTLSVRGGTISVRGKTFSRRGRAVALLKKKIVCPFFPFRSGFCQAEPGIRYSKSGYFKEQAVPVPYQFAL